MEGILTPILQNEETEARIPQNVDLNPLTLSGPFPKLCSVGGETAFWI